MPGPVDDERHVRDSDHHCVARADLEELLRPERGWNPDFYDDLAWPKRGPLRADDEIVEGHVSTPPSGCHDDVGVECGQHRERVTCGRRGGEVASQRARVADLWGSDRARRLGKTRQEIAEPRCHELGVGDAGAEHDLGAFESPPLELLDLAQAHNRRRAPETEIDFHHEVGPAGQELGVRVLLERVEGLFQRDRQKYQHKYSL